ncbi:MAG: 5'/3'-nucleotidase SurE [Spirochaetaceae bacterium]|jgi:5'-nucleotidase|nr:5'/3'-nucleotidase SurE [Spirochaetaceae bacterium]
MRILATNDDGYKSEGIIVLAKKLRKAGHKVVVLAPDRERSCASHSMTLFAPVTVKQIDDETWACSGTPVDCALTGVSPSFGYKPELVVSGINSGSNLGIDVVFSGTVGAARQAAFHKVPGIAFSLCGYHAPFYWEQAADWAASHLDELLALWNEDVFVNVNMPNIETIPEKPEICALSARRYKDEIVIKRRKLGAAQSCEFVFNGFEEERYANNDRDVIMHGKVAVTPVLLEPATTVKTEPF